MDILEVEIKAWCEGHEDVRRKVLSMGGIFEERVTESDTYFNHPSRDFRETDEAFRIRRSNCSSVITYKGPKLSGRAKTRKEEELGITDPDVMKSILTSLGFREVGTVEKTREVYLLDKVHVTLDSVSGLGTFVELEKMDADRERVEGELFALAEGLGLTRFERKSYLELLLRKFAKSD